MRSERGKGDSAVLWRSSNDGAKGSDFAYAKSCLEL